MKKQELYRQLVERYTSGTASTDELQVFFHLLDRGALDQELVAVTREGASPQRRGALVPIFRLLQRHRAAAAIIGLAVGLGILYWITHSRTHKEVLTVSPKPYQNDIAPGGYHALLTLADGRQVTLDSTQGGATIATQGHTAIIGTADGELAYRPAAREKTVYYNTLTTNKGDTYKLLLPDGSAIWLNSASSLHYPTQFSGRYREVTLDGEGYFEIAAIPSQPFIVHTAKEDLHVLGTHFDVFAYTDEPNTVTTLLEGAISLASEQDKQYKQLLRGSGQTSLEAATGFHPIPQPNLDAAIAWKNNIFQFEDIPLSVIMRQLARWYDVDVEYQGIDGDHRFSAYISRSLPISSVLNLIGDTRGVSFEIKGKKVIVKKYQKEPNPK